MTIGTSILLIAVGAILRYAVNANSSVINIQTVGLILMIAGIVGLVIGLYMYASTRRTAYTRPVERDRYAERDPLA